MSKVKVVMPQMGESITTGTITKWHKKPGDTIELDEILLEISTDKVESEIPSPVKGRVEKVLYPEGETVDVGLPIAEIEDDLSVPFKESSSAAPVDGAPKKTGTDKSPLKGEATPKPLELAAKAPEQQASVPEKQVEGAKRFYTPLVKKMAQEVGVPLSELEHLEGSGAGGRVNREDLEKYLAERKAKGAPTGAPKKGAEGTISLPQVDVLAGYSGRYDEVPMDNMRKVIARNMIASKLTSPHVNSISEVDLTHLVKFRESFKGQFEKQEGFKLTYTPFIVRALVMALKDYPLVNASVGEGKVIVKKDINLGLAVAVPGNGLIVPVIHNADNLNMLGLCRKINELAEKARAKKLTMAELQGGTFTFTNVGSFGTLLATPVILQPQVGIYASGVIQKRVVVMPDDSIAVRSMMYGTHTYDHRIIDGELGGKFLEAAHRHLREMKPEDLF